MPPCGRASADWRGLSARFRKIVGAGLGWEPAILMLKAFGSYHEQADIRIGFRHFHRGETDSGPSSHRVLIIDFQKRP
jgi:hypothetical protein